MNNEDWKKVAETINSCNTYQHIDAAYEMINNYRKLHPGDDTTDLFLLISNKQREIDNFYYSTIHATCMYNQQEEQK